MNRKISWVLALAAMFGWMVLPITAQAEESKGEDSKVVEKGEHHCKDKKKHHKHKKHKKGKKKHTNHSGGGDGTNPGGHGNDNGFDNPGKK